LHGVQPDAAAVHHETAYASTKNAIVNDKKVA